MPTDIRSGTVPTEVGIVAASRSAAAHLDRRAGGLPGVVVAPEQQQEGITAELDEGARPLVGQREHGGEDAVEDLGELLGTDAAPAGEPLGQVREA